MNLFRYSTSANASRAAHFFLCLTLAFVMSFAGAAEGQDKKNKKNNKKKKNQKQSQPAQKQQQNQQNPNQQAAKRDAQTLLRTDRELLAYATGAARKELGDLINQQNAGPLTALGRIYEQERNYGEAERCLKKASQLDVTDPSPWAFLGESYLHQKRQAEATSAFREAEKRANALVKKTPGDASAHYYLGLARQRLKKFGPALESLARARDLDPKNAMPVYHMGVTKAFQQQWQEALNLLSAAIEINPNVAYSYYYRGQAASKLQRKDLLIVDFERFLELAPDSPEAPIARRTLNAARR